MFYSHSCRISVFTFRYVWIIVPIRSPGQELGNQGATGEICNKMMYFFPCHLFRLSTIGTVEINAVFEGPSLKAFRDRVEEVRDARFEWVWHLNSRTRFIQFHVFSTSFGLRVPFFSRISVTNFSSCLTLETTVKLWVSSVTIPPAENTFTWTCRTILPRKVGNENACWGTLLSHLPLAYLIRIRTNRYGISRTAYSKSACKIFLKSKVWCNSNRMD